jgi:hypothetical protein
MLAAISFRFVTNQSIPKISYLTHLVSMMVIEKFKENQLKLKHLHTLDNKVRSAYKELNGTFKIYFLYLELIESS